MLWFEDVYKRRIRLTDERQEHIESDHPQMSDQIAKGKKPISIGLKKTRRLTV